MAGAAAIGGLAGLAAGEEAHGCESDDGEDFHMFILTEIGKKQNMGPHRALDVKL